jgi:UDP-N-acetylmuramate-alanine ligase
MSFPEFLYEQTKNKKLKPFPKDIVYKAFEGNNLHVYDSSDELFRFIKAQNYSNPVYLFMSSGDFNGFDITKLLE